MKTIKELLQEEGELVWQYNEFGKTETLERIYLKRSEIKELLEEALMQAETVTFVRGRQAAKHLDGRNP